MNLKWKLLNNKNFQYDVIVIFITLLLPFLFFAYNVVPKDSQIWTTSWFHIDSGYYEDASFYFWVLFVKLFTLSILSIWFLTSKKRWRMFILVPIVIEINKIIVTNKIIKVGLNLDFYVIETLIFSIPYIILLVFLSKYFQKKTNNPYNNLINYEINNQVINLTKFKLNSYKVIKDELLLLEKNKDDFDEKEYLIKLISLRDRLNFDN